MSKVKAIIVGVIVVLFFSMGVTIRHFYKSHKYEKARAERLWQNNLELSAKDRQHTKVIYSKEEFIKILSDSLKTALNDLKIKPKTVTKIVERVITDRDTIEVEVSVNPLAELSWTVQDSGKCWRWEAELAMVDDFPDIDRTLFEYRNKTMDYYYWYRPKKFLWFHYGKKKIKQVTVPECGQANEKIIEVIKE